LDEYLESPLKYMKSNFGQLILIELISSKKYPISIIEIGDGKNSI